MNPNELMPNVHPIFQVALGPFLGALEPRTCACGEPTGSPCLDQCERCEVAP